MGDCQERQFPLRAKITAFPFSVSIQGSHSEILGGISGDKCGKCHQPVADWVLAERKFQTVGSQ